MNYKYDKQLKLLKEAWDKINESSSVINAVGDIGKKAHTILSVSHEAQVEEKGKLTKQAFVALIKEIVIEAVGNRGTEDSKSLYIKTTEGEIILKPSKGREYNQIQMKYLSHYNGEEDSGTIFLSKVNTVIKGNIQDVKVFSGSSELKSNDRQRIASDDRVNIEELINTILGPHDKVIKKYALHFLKKFSSEMNDKMSSLNDEPSEDELYRIRDLKNIAKNGWEGVSDEFFNQNIELVNRYVYDMDTGNVTAYGDLPQERKNKIARDVTKKLIDIMRSGDLKQVKRSGYSNASVATFPSKPEDNVKRSLNRNRFF